jgi:hypothetical protein
MYTIHKHVLKPEEMQTFKIQGYKLLSVMNQFDNIVLYVALNKDDEFKFDYEILVLGTGHETEQDIELEWEFLNTVSMENGHLMFHVFYRRPKDGHQDC